MNKCLGCYQPIATEQRIASGGEYHARCARKLFGSTEPPLLDWTVERVEELARKSVLQRVAVTGVQEKLSLEVEHRKGQRDRLTIVGVEGEYILKPPSHRYPNLPEIEDLTMHLAEICKITTAKHGLIRFQDGALGYLTRRFDRVKHRGTITKLAMEDMCQLTERLTEDKYHGSVEQIGKVIARHATHPGIDNIRLFELVIFNLLCGNADMHLKNYSLMTNADGIVTLSPAYDLVSTALVTPKQRDETALTIGGAHKNITRNKLRSLGSSLGIVAKATETILDRFPMYSRRWLETIDSSFLSKDLKERYRLLILGNTARYLLQD